MDTAIPPREETGSQISARLLEVIAHAKFEVLPELYAFGPLTEGVTPRKDALACVRDGGAWSKLVPVDDGATPTAFRIFSFHFTRTRSVSRAPSSCSSARVGTSGQCKSISRRHPDDDGLHAARAEGSLARRVAQYLYLGGRPRSPEESAAWLQASLASYEQLAPATSRSCARKTER